MTTFKDKYVELKTRIDNLRSALYDNLIKNRILMELDAIKRSIQDVPLFYEWVENSTTKYMPMVAKRFKAYGRPMSALAVGDTPPDLGGDFDMPSIKATWIGATQPYSYGTETKELPALPEITFDESNMENLEETSVGKASSISVVLVTSPNTFTDTPDFTDYKFDYYTPDNVYLLGKTTWNIDSPETITIFLDWEAFVVEIGNEAQITSVEGYCTSYHWVIDGQEVNVHVIYNAKMYLSVEISGSPEQRIITAPIALYSYNAFATAQKILFGGTVMYNAESGYPGTFAYIPNYTTYPGFVRIGDTPS